MVDEVLRKDGLDDSVCPFPVFVFYDSNVTLDSLVH